MSVDIEMDSEKEVEAKVRPLLDEAPVEQNQPRGLASPKVQRLLIVGGVVALAALVGLFFYYHDRESTDDAQVDGHITPIASKVYGRVQGVLVDDNQQVQAGQILVKIDPRDYQAALDEAKAALALAESEAQSAGVDVPRTAENVHSNTSSADAQLLAAQADLTRAEVSHQQAQTADLAFAKANVEKSQANAFLAQADLARYGPLLQKAEISQQQYDAAKANADATTSALKADEEKISQAQRNVEMTKAQVEAARARVQQAQAAVEGAQADKRQVNMRTADAQAKVAKVEQARAALEAAELNLSYADVVAPVAGVATHKQVEPGQIVQAGQGLMVVVPLQNVWVTANFKETQLRKMKPGQEAFVTVDTYDQTFKGHVDSLAGATGAVLSLLPPENATGNYVKVVQRVPVKIVLDPIPPDKAVLRPGMNVDATVITK
jgi:membrane fusion protein, multidrug efflux system